MADTVITDIEEIDTTLDPVTEDHGLEMLGNVRDQPVELRRFSRAIFRIGGILKSLGAGLASKSDSGHTHTPESIGAEPTFIKNDAFNKNFGTQIGTVAEGNHGHLPENIGAMKESSTSATLIWSGDASSGTLTLSESYKNFNFIAVAGDSDSYGTSSTNCVPADFLDVHPIETNPRNDTEFTVTRISDTQLSLDTYATNLTDIYGISRR